jgi:hypothetical protein
VEEYVTSLLASLSGVVIAVTAFALASRIGANRAASFGVAAVIGLSTMVWRYSTVLFSHAPSAAILLVGLLVACRSLERRSSRGLLLLGFLAGMALAVDYSSAVPFGGMLAVLLIIRWRQGSNVVVDLAAFVAGSTLPVAFLATYQWAAFGSPLHTSYAYKAGELYAPNTTIAGSYSGPITNLIPMLLSPTRGLLSWNPVLLLAPLGFIALVRRNARVAVLFLASALPFLMLQSKFYMWWGGRTNDSRFLTPLIPILLVPLALPLSHTAGRIRRPMLVGGLALLGVAGFLLQAIRLVFSLGHFERLNSGLVIVKDTTLDLGAGLHQLVLGAFPSLSYAPATLAVAVAVAMALTTVRSRGGRATDPRPTTPGIPP